MKAHLQSLPPEELLRVRPAYYALTYGYDLVKRRFKANFDPSQPRVPAGNPDGGQWTSEGGGGLGDLRVISDANDDWKPGAQYAAGPRGPRDRLPPLHVPRAGEGDVSPYRPGRISIENNAQTGFSTIDENTEKLRAILENVVNAKGEGYGPEYGKQVHYDFGDAVKEAIRSGDLRGDIRVEHTYPEGQGLGYGSKGTIRTDVVLRNELGEVIVIYDVKTGGAYLDVKCLSENILNAVDRL